MTDAAIYVSLLSLGVSAVTLYLAHLRPPKISFIVGSTIGVNHQEDGFSIYVPITFTNAAHRPGLVNKCSVLFTKVGSTPTSHYIEWTEFRKRNERIKQYNREDFAGPLQVEGRSSVSKLVWFRWREGNFQFSEGRYTVEFFTWIENEPRASLCQKHEFYISPIDSTELAGYKENDKSTIQWLGVDKQIEPNKLLTEHEITVLLR